MPPTLLVNKLIEHNKHFKTPIPDISLIEMFSKKLADMPDKTQFRELQLSEHYRNGDWRPTPKTIFVLKEMAKYLTLTLYIKKIRQCFPRGTQSRHSESP